MSNTEKSVVKQRPDIKKHVIDDQTDFYSFRYKVSRHFMAKV